MYEVKTEVRIIPDGYESVNAFFHNHVFRNYVELGAKLIGRWVDEDHTLITEIWGFQDKAHYEEFFSLRKGTSHYQNSRLEKIANDKWIISKKETHMMPTGVYFQPRHSISASVYVENEAGEVLLVRSLHRSDTMELPGGAVDKNETLIDAAVRETKEETGLNVKIIGLVYVTQNISNNITSFVFHGAVIDGELTDCEDETTDVGFYDLSGDNFERLIRRPMFRERILESRKLNYLPLDIFSSRPYELIERFELKVDQ